MPENLTWQGFREQTTSETTIAVTEYYDCDGSLGINAVMLLCVKWDCPPCQRESSELEAKMAAWAPLGIKVVVALLEGPSDQTPTVDDAWGWKQNWNLQSVDVVADPDHTLIPEAAFGAPLVSLVDPRTMSVVYWQQGYDGDFSELESLAAQNAGP